MTRTRGITATRPLTRKEMAALRYAAQCCVDKPEFKDRRQTLINGMLKLDEQGLVKRRKEIATKAIRDARQGTRDFTFEGAKLNSTESHAYGLTYDWARREWMQGRTPKR